MARQAGSVVILYMGIQLINAALVLHAPHLSGRGFKVFARMVATALDKPNSDGHPANLYYNGWEPLALVIGQDPSEPRKAYEQVRRVLKELETKGLIDRLEDHPQTGTAQTFRINLATETEGQSQPKRRGSRNRNGGKSPAETEGPRKHQEDAGLNPGTNPIVSKARTDRANSLTPMDGTCEGAFVDDGSGRNECVCSLPRASHPGFGSAA